MEVLLETFGTSNDSCLLTYASMLCEQTPQGNEHVDDLIAKLMQNCEPEHIDRLLDDFRTYKETINDRNEARYNPADKGINWQKFAGKKTTSEPISINLRRRERVLTQIFKGIVRNPNIKMNQIITLLRVNDDVTQKFIDTQFDVLQEALLKGECVFTREELIEGSKKYIGIKAEKLEEMLDAADRRQPKDKKITPSEAVKNALNKGTTTDIYIARCVEHSELNPENIK